MSIDGEVRDERPGTPGAARAMMSDVRLGEHLVERREVGVDADERVGAERRVRP